MQSGDALKPSIHDASVRLSSASALAAVHGVSASTLCRVDGDGVERLFHLFPQRVGLVGCQPLAAENDRRLEVFFGDVEELEVELLGVADPRRMIRSNQLAAALYVLAGDEIGEAEDAPTDAIARLGDSDVVAGLRQLVCRRQAAEAAADDDDPPACSPLGQEQAVAHEERRGRAERALQHLAARDAVRLAVTTIELSVEVGHSFFAR